MSRAKALSAIPEAEVIAYLGCSRKGWYSSRQDDLDYSPLYESKFYRNLFSNAFPESNYGMLVAASQVGHDSILYKRQCIQVDSIRIESHRRSGDADTHISSGKVSGVYCKGAGRGTGGSRQGLTAAGCV